MLSIALTGNVASGKSTVADRWELLGVPVVRADQLAREAVEPGTSGLDAVVDRFGSDVLAADGTLDRAEMRRRVFGDDEARARLEAIVHPEVWRLREIWLEHQLNAGAPMVVAEIPLLFETGRQDLFDLTVLVEASEEERLERVTEGRGVEEEVARKLLASQMPSREKRARADRVIENRGTLEELDAKADALLAELRARAGVAPIRLDLHMHTHGSWDCLSDPTELLERAREQGLDRIALTDHNELEVALRMADAHPDRVIAGEEVKTEEGIDVIGLYLTEVIPKGTPALETVEAIREQGGIPYLPHPYAKGKGGGGAMADELAAVVDVVEVFNARMHPGRLNRLGEDLARRHGRLRGAGSDAHTLGELGNAWVEVPAHPSGADALRAALGTARIEGDTAPHWVHLASTWAKVRRKLPF